MECGFLRREHNGALYTLFVPRLYREDRQWPAILFLHGAGETGWDGVQPRTVGIGPAVQERVKSFPFLVLFPQCRHRSWHAGTEDADRALAILDAVRSEYTIDDDQLHLTGISIGGYGTWSLATAEPGRWASIVPVCGGGSPRHAAALKRIPCWAFHGDADEIIPVDRSREMVRALRTAGADPRYTEYPGVGHNCWDLAYATPDLYPWMLRQRRGFGARQDPVRGILGET